MIFVLINELKAPLNIRYFQLDRFNQKLRKEVRKAPPLTEPASISKLMKKPEREPTPPPPKDDESDDGLEPLPFPGPEEPIPDMEDIEGEGEFDLDPLTGKVKMLVQENKV